MRVKGEKMKKVRALCTLGTIRIWLPACSDMDQIQLWIKLDPASRQRNL